MTPLLEARGIRKSFAIRHAWGRPTRLQAVDGVDLAVRPGECLAVVGESGSGKTTLGKCLIRLVEPDEGFIRFDGEDLLAMSDRELRKHRADFQMVFQDAGSAMDPRLRIRAQIGEPLRLHHHLAGDALEDRVASLLETVGLARSLAERYPHQLSGGQRQRVGIARALATEPKLLILDEPVSALDVSVRARLLALLQDLREKLRLTMICIAHDLAMVEQIADRVAVMYRGSIVETGPSREVFERPAHAYTASLLQAVPIPDPARRSATELLSEEISDI